MDLVTWTAIIVGSNVGTYLLVKWQFYSLMKQTKLLPLFLAIIHNKVGTLSIDADIEEGYQPIFKRNMKACGDYVSGGK